MYSPAKPPRSSEKLGVNHNPLNFLVTTLRVFVATRYRNASAAFGYQIFFA